MLRPDDPSTHWPTRRVCYFRTDPVVTFQKITLKDELSYDKNVKYRFEITFVVPNFKKNEIRASARHAKNLHHRARPLHAAFRVPFHLDDNDVKFYFCNEVKRF